jgi:hypothetical protein
MADNPFEVIANLLTPHGVNAVGVNAQGQLIDANGNPTTLLKQPNAFERALSPYAQQISSLNDQAAAQGVQQQQQNILQRNLLGQAVNTMPYQDNPFLGAYGQPQQDPTGQINNYHSFTNGSPTIANANNLTLSNQENQGWVSALQHPELSPSYSREQVGAQGGLNTGLPGSIGVTGTRADLASEQNRLIGSTAEQQSGLPWKTPLEQSQDADYNIGLNPYRMSTIGDVGQTMQNQTALGNIISGQDLAQKPYINDAANRTDAYGLIHNNLGLIKTPGAGSINPDGTVNRGSFMTDSMRQFQAMQQGLNGGTGQSITTKGGLNVNYNPPVNVFPKTIGQQSQSQPQPINLQSYNAVPLEKYPDILADPATGRFYNSQHQDITDQLQPQDKEVLGRAYSEQTQEKQQNAIQAKHDADTAALKAQKAALDAKQKQIESNHQNNNAPWVDPNSPVMKLIGALRPVPGYNYNTTPSYQSNY